METTFVSPKAQEVLDKARSAFGFVPNLIRELATHSPAVAEVYLSGNAAIADASLTAQEQQAVILAISSYNDCHYCTAAHTFVGKMVGLPEGEIEAIKAGGLPQDERLRDLVSATRRILGKRGWLNDADLAEFEALGIDRGQLYEIVALIGIKMISNYVNHIAYTEVDVQFK